MTPVLTFACLTPNAIQEVIAYILDEERGTRIAYSESNSVENLVQSSGSAWLTPNAIQEVIAYILDEERGTRLEPAARHRSASGIQGWNLL